MLLKHYASLIALACVLVGCEYNPVNTKQNDGDAVGLYSAKSSTTPKELEFLKWLYHNHIGPELLPDDDSDSKSHFFVYIQIAPITRQTLDERDGAHEASKLDISDNFIDGYALVEGKTKMQLRHLSSGLIWKTASSSVIAKSDYDPSVWAGDQRNDSFIDIVQACASTDGILESVIGIKERDGKGYSWSELQSYLMVGGYVDGSRCIYIVPNPYHEERWSTSDISEVEKNASIVTKNGRLHFSVVHSE